MKRPNKLLNKKYISSLAVAAFLILSVLTAYNIKIDRSNPEETNTQTEETARESEEAMNQADGQNPLNEQNREKSEKEESGNDDENTGSQTDENLKCYLLAYRNGRTAQELESRMKQLSVDENIKKEIREIVGNFEKRPEEHISEEQMDAMLAGFTKEYHRSTGS